MKSPPAKESLSRGRSRSTHATLFTGWPISTVTSRSTPSASWRSTATSRPFARSWPPAHVKPAHSMRMPPALATAVVFAPSSAYAFSRVNTRNPNRWPSNATDGSGKSTLNLLKPRPRGGTKTSLLQVSGRGSRRHRRLPSWGASRGETANRTCQPRECGRRESCARGSRAPERAPRGTRRMAGAERHSPNRVSRLPRGNCADSMARDAARSRSS